MRPKPFAYQREGVEFIQRFKGSVLLAWEQGVGKTPVPLWWVEQYSHSGNVVIVCPAGLKVQWQRECRRFCSWKAVILEGTKPYQHKSRDGIYIINYDILQYWVEVLCKLKPRLLVMDEGHRIRNAAIATSRAARAIREHSRSAIVLTGTPMLNRPADIWNLMNIVNRKFYPEFLPFAMEFCDAQPAAMGHWDISGASNLKKLHKQLKRHGMSRLRKSEVLKDLPPILRSVIPLPLKDFKSYELARDDIQQWLRQNKKRLRRIDYLNQLGLLQRLAGELKVEAVIEWLEDWLIESDGKHIHFGVHQKYLKPIYEHFQKQAVFVHGGVHPSKRQALVDRFCKDKKCRLFIGNIIAAGSGWNGTCASAVSFGELDWIPANHSQAEARPHRVGAKNAINVYYLVALNTIEEKMCQRIQAKQEIFDQTIDGKKVKGSINVMDLLDLKMGRKLLV